MTGYIVHYNDGGPDMIRTVFPPSTTTEITGLTNGDTYIISVEATSQHLSGESKEMTITLREFDSCMKEIGAVSFNMWCPFRTHALNHTSLVLGFPRGCCVMYYQ